MQARTAPFAQLGNDAVLNLNTNHQSTGFPVSKSGVGTNASAAWAGSRCGDKIVMQMMTIAYPRILSDLFFALFIVASGPVLSLAFMIRFTKRCVREAGHTDRGLCSGTLSGSVAARLPASNWSAWRCLR